MKDTTGSTKSELLQVSIGLHWEQITIGRLALRREIRVRLELGSLEASGCAALQGPNRV